MIETSVIQNVLLIQSHRRVDASSLSFVYLPMEDSKAILEKVSLLCTYSSQDLEGLIASDIPLELLPSFFYLWAE
jgi:hypothetical protein